MPGGGRSSAQQKKRSPPRADERVLGFLNSLLTLADLQARISIDPPPPALAIPALTVMPVTRAYNLAHTCAGSATHLQSNPMSDVAALRTCLGFLHLPSGSAHTVISVRQRVFRCSLDPNAWRARSQATLQWCARGLPVSWILIHTRGVRVQLCAPRQRDIQVSRAETRGTHNGTSKPTGCAMASNLVDGLLHWPRIRVHGVSLHADAFLCSPLRGSLELVPKREGKALRSG